MKFFNKIFGKSNKFDIERLSFEIEHLTLLLKESEQRVEECRSMLRDARKSTIFLEKENKKLKDDIEKLKEKNTIKVNYQSARKKLIKSKLSFLEKRLIEAPENVVGSTVIYDKRKKTTSLVSFKTKAEALKIINKAKKGTIDIVG